MKSRSKPVQSEDRSLKIKIAKLEEKALKPSLHKLEFKACPGSKP